MVARLTVFRAAAHRQIEEFIATAPVEDEVQDLGEGVGVQDMPFQNDRFHQHEGTSVGVTPRFACRAEPKGEQSGVGLSAVSPQPEAGRGNAGDAANRFPRRSATPPREIPRVEEARPDRMRAHKLAE